MAVERLVSTRLGLGGWPQRRIDPAARRVPNSMGRASTGNNQDEP
jgi:hypothetical protein